MKGILNKTNMCWHIKSEDFYDERFTNNGVPIDRRQWKYLDPEMLGEEFQFEIEEVYIEPTILGHDYTTFIARLEKARM